MTTGGVEDGGFGWHGTVMALMLFGDGGVTKNGDGVYGGVSWRLRWCSVMWCSIADGNSDYGC